MNLTEHGEFLKETFHGAFIGKIVDIEDPQRLGRVRVRVHGVYDEPIREEDIPWAIPASSARRPAIGDVVPVVFVGGSHYRPVYF